MKQNKNYLIIKNLNDHEGYDGEKVTIISGDINDSAGYVTVENKNGDKWVCGVEELKKI